MKAISMRCTQEQFDKIKDKLSNYNLKKVKEFESYPYLVNNFWGGVGNLTNLHDSVKMQYDRTVFEEWDEDVFLEYCGVEAFPEHWYLVGDDNNFEVLESWRKSVCSSNWRCSTGLKGYKMLLSKNVNDGSNYFGGRLSTLLKDRDYTHYKPITFEQFKKHVLKQKDMQQKLTVPITDVVKIHDIACSGWKKTIAEYLKRVNPKLEITFTQQEVDDMFKAANDVQTPVLESVFGKKVPVIDYDKIVPGSVVRIQSTGQEINSANTGVDFGKPVTVVFFKTKHHVNPSGNVDKTGRYGSYCTFLQEGKIAVFAADATVDYITEVIQY